MKRNLSIVPFAACVLTAFSLMMLPMSKPALGQTIIVQPNGGRPTGQGGGFARFPQQGGPPAGVETLKTVLFNPNNFYLENENWQEQRYLRCKVPNAVGDGQQAP